VPQSRERNVTPHRIEATIEAKHEFVEIGTVAKPSPRRSKVRRHNRQTQEIHRFSAFAYKPLTEQDLSVGRSIASNKSLADWRFLRILSLMEIRNVQRREERCGESDGT
jgi:hypothetical protein